MLVPQVKMFAFYLVNLIIFAFYHNIVQFCASTLHFIFSHQRRFSVSGGAAFSIENMHSVFFLVFYCCSFPGSG